MTARRGRGRPRTVIGPYWIGAAEAGLSQAEAARMFGRPPAHAALAAKYLGITFTRKRANKLPEMSAADRKLYRYFRENGITRTDALREIGVSE